MTIKASGRSALILAAGLLICASAPALAADGDAQAGAPVAAVGTAVDTSQPTKTTRHHGTRKVAAKSRKSDRVGKKPAVDDATAKADDAKPATPDATISPAVANANAQWPAETPTTATNLNTPPANSPVQAAIQPEQPAVAAPDSPPSNMQVVASDQLNDLDRAATDHQPPLTLAKATIDTPTAPEEASSSSNSPWDKTSMVGKIFLAFGGLLTMASAARMFMA